MPDIVVCNTSPLQYLHQLGHLELLPYFYQQVRIPPAVIRELAAGRELGISLPDPSMIDWLLEHAPQADTARSISNALGAGEREVLALATEFSDVLVLIDDGRARRVGQRLGISMTGTVGILVRATREGRIPRLAVVLDQLAELGFRLGREARTVALRHVGEV